MPSQYCEDGLFLPVVFFRTTPYVIALVIAKFLHTFGLFVTYEQLKIFHVVQFLFIVKLWYVMSKLCLHNTYRQVTVFLKLNISIIFSQFVTTVFDLQKSSSLFNQLFLTSDHCTLQISSLQALSFLWYPFLRSSQNEDWKSDKKLIYNYHRLKYFV